jgi:hypothetical protein
MTLPTFLIGGGGVAGTGNATSDGDDLTGLLPCDIILLVVHSQGGQPATAPTGWSECPGSPVSEGTGAGSLNLSVFYKLANGRMDATSNDATVLDTGDHIIAEMYAFRGVDNADPFDASASGSESTADTSLSTTGLTTTTDDCLYVGIIGNAIDGLTTEQLSGAANGDLANVTHADFGQAASGTGGGWTVVTGEKASAGSIGATTGTMAANTKKAWLELALKPNQGHPYIVSHQTAASGGTGDIVLAWPTPHQAGDVGVVWVESTGGEPVSTPTGYSTVGDSPQATGSGTNGTQLTVFYRVAESSSEPDQTITDPGDHVTRAMAVVRGCAASPVNDTAGGVNASAGTTATIPGATTTVDRCLVLAASSRDNDSAASSFSAWANSNLGDGTVGTVAEVFDLGTATGNGGGIGIAYGVMETAGSVGDTTATVSVSTVHAYHCIALLAGQGVTARFWATIIG